MKTWIPTHSHNIQNAKFRLFLGDYSMLMDALIRWSSFKFEIHNSRPNIRMEFKFKYIIYCLRINLLIKYQFIYKWKFTPPYPNWIKENQTKKISKRSQLFYSLGHNFQLIWSSFTFWDKQLFSYNLKHIFSVFLVIFLR